MEENPATEIEGGVNAEFGDKKASAFEIVTELNKNEDQLNYEEERTKHKLNYFKSALLFIQAAAGLSLFTLQKPLLQVGLIAGAIVTVIVGYTTAYGLVQLSSLATDIEKDFSYKRRIKNFYELTEHIQGKHVPVMRWLMMIAGMGMMYASSISNILLISSTLEHHIGVPQWITKTVTFFVLCGTFFFFIEPEKIKYVNMYMTILLFVITYIIFARNIFSWANGEGPPFSDIPLFKWKRIGVWGGNLAYAFEVASGYLSLRLTASNHVNYEGITAWMTVLVGINYYFVSAAHIVGNKPEEITDNSFQMMSKHGVIWTVLIYLFIINTLYTFTFNTMFTSEIIETIPTVHTVLADPTDNTIHRGRLIILRIIIWAIAVIISFFASDIINLLNISGSVFSPIVSYFGPLVLSYTYKKQKGEEISKFKKFHDLTYIKFALTISIWGIVNAIRND